MSRHVVITGASSGIGRATALRLDREGFYVYAGVRRRSDFESLEKEGSERLQPVYLELLNFASIVVAAKHVEEQVHACGAKGIQGLVNNAGITISGPLEFLDLDELRRQLEVNLVGPVAVTQAFLPLLRPVRGRIINLGSIGGRMAAPLCGPYTASKFGLEAISDAQRLELAPWGIFVSLVEPGATDTPVFTKGQAYVDALIAAAPDRALELYGDSIQRVREAFREMARTAIDPEEVARVIQRILYARHPRARYLVGPDARLQAWAVRLLPDRVRDLLLTRLLRYPREDSDRLSFRWKTVGGAARQLGLRLRRSMKGG